MRKNFALLGATLVACAVSGPVLAGQNGKDIGNAFELAALALSKTDVSAAPLTTGAIDSGDEVKPEAVREVAKPDVVAVKKPVIKKRAPERLVAKINLSSQTMKVMVDGKVKHSWKISSGAKGYHTPTGSYKPYYMTSMHYSKKYNNAPMPHSVFYRGGFAVHATSSVRRLGSPASHGCIRLSPGNARKFFKLVQKYKKAGTRIRIAGSTPSSRSFKKRYTRRKPRTNRNRYTNSWANYGAPKRVRYRARRRTAANTRRITIRRNVRTSRSNRRRSSGRLLHWQF